MIKGIKTKSLSSVRPPAWLQAEYGRKLLHLISDMNKSISYWVQLKYKQQLPRIVAEDSSPADELYYELLGQFDKWDIEFKKSAKKIAEDFANKQEAYTRRSLKSKLVDAGFTVKLNLSRAVKDQMDSIILENVGLINSLSYGYRLEVAGMIQRSVQTGRDLAYVTKELVKRFGITKRRAVIIARDQNNKATSMLQLARASELDITHARWKHNGGSKVPRHSHVLADGSVFDIKTGLKIDGVLTFPGIEINCQCTSELIVPEFNS